MLVIHGDHDELVPVQQSELFVKRAQEAAAPPVRLMVRKRKGHGWEGFSESKEDLEPFVEWFDLHLRGIEHRDSVEGTGPLNR